MRSLLLPGSAALMLFGATYAHAKVLDFKFSFSDNGSQGFIFEVPGTVTGEITGLINNATSAAIAVFMDSAPAALGFHLPYDTTTGGFVVSNLFTVSDGHVVGDNYDVNGTVALIFGLSSYANYVEGPIGYETGNFDGLDGIAFTAIPEPSTRALMLLGFAGLGFAGYWQARQLSTQERIRPEDRRTFETGRQR